MDADKKRLWVSGQFIEVTDEVYDAYMKGDRKMRYFESDLKTERFLMDENGQIRQVIPSREDSLDRLMDDNAEQFADRHESVEDMVLRRISIERLYKALDRLTVPFPVSWTVKMKKKQKETQDILSYHTQAAGCSDKARAKASGGRQPIEECGRTGL